MFEWFSINRYLKGPLKNRCLSERRLVCQFENLFGEQQADSAHTHSLSHTLTHGAINTSIHNRVLCGLKGYLDVVLVVLPDII